ncbi:MAG: CoA transferase [Chloroflexi bacterium]|nr:CoA transferase [Chloroflexota bacterium]
MSDRALSSTKVLDLTHHISGPYATKMLADMGADVIKVERPGSGDPCRALGPFLGDDPHPDKSLPFLYLNTSKRGITLNLKSSDGQSVLRELVKWADLVMVNFAPATLETLGLTYDSLKTINPNLVMVAITNFGLVGPYRDYKASDLVEYALSGLMYIFGSYDREPIAHALHQAQFRAGTVAAGASLIALYGAKIGGQKSTGNLVDVSIMEVMAAALRDTFSQYTYQGIVRRRSPRFGMVLGRSVSTSDGYLIPTMIGAGTDWEIFAEFLGAPELKDERFATQEDRIRNARELDEVLRRRFAEHRKLELFHLAHAWRFHFGVVLTPREVTESDQLDHRGFFVEVEHPVAGRLQYPGASAIYSETPWQTSRPAPALGQHNSEVLGGMLGYSKDDLVLLRRAGAI